MSADPDLSSGKFAGASKGFPLLLTCFPSYPDARFEGESCIGLVDLPS
jgi:hypothetical protein